jgi:predicted DsbA family dithiol-disulfide isomerase
MTAELKIGNVFSNLRNRNGLLAIVAAATLVAVYLVYSIVPPPKLEFRDRSFPPGFRELVLESTSSPFDPLVSVSPASKLEAREVCDALFRDLTAPSVGNRDSDIQIVAFLDYQCPYCKKLSAILSSMQADNIRIVYKEWPILGDGSVLAARAGLAADKQGKYPAFHTRLMNSRFIPTVAYVEGIAAELGLDLTQLRGDMNSATTMLAIQRTSALASALHLVGTPVLVVGRTIVQGEITRNQLERLINNETHLKSPKVC